MNGDPNDLREFGEEMERFLPPDKVQDMRAFLLLVVGQAQLDGSRWAVQMFRNAAAAAPNVEVLQHFAERLNWALDVRAVNLRKPSTGDAFDDAVRKLHTDKEE